MKDNLVINNISEWQMVQQVQRMLASVLKDIPVLSNIVVQPSSVAPCDIEISAELEGGGAIKILCEVKSRGEPQYIRRGIMPLVEWGKLQEGATSNQYYTMIGAPYISPASAKLCEELGVGYIDLSGNCLVRWQGIYVRVEGNPNKYKDSRGGKAIFERTAIKSSAILRTLLQNPRKTWRVQELSIAASASLGQISKVKRFLEEREYCGSNETGFFLQKPQELVQEWGKVYNSKSNNIYDYYTLDSIQQLEQRLMDMKEKTGIDYALTSYAAAVRYAPTVRYNKVHVYIPLQDLMSATEFLQCKPVTSGSNLSIIVPYDPSVMMNTQNIKGVQVVSPVQVCLDLLGLKGRGEEAALAVMNKEFGQ